MTRRVDVFFYGSFMNQDVLAQAGVRPERFDVASVDGWAFHYQPRANLIPAPEAASWGVVADCAHDELDRLYARARDDWGESYLPEAVLCQFSDGRVRAALTYLAEPKPAQAPDPDYARRIVEPAEACGFPPEYLARVGAEGAA